MSKAKAKTETVEVKSSKRGQNTDSKTSRQNIALKYFEAKVNRQKLMSKPEEV